ncbi:MAG TPA: MarR family transcriptional regulator [Dehalococcoidia bacterium]|nr:MarR family transcriptional regulator [Dehalococcoidia bacterium]
MRDEAFRLFGRLVTRSDPGRLEAWADLGLTMTQLRLLFLLRLEDGLSAGAIADRLGVTPSTLTRIMDRLVRSDLVRREEDGNDRRLVRHRLTAEARRTIEEMERFGRARMDRMLAQLGPEELERVVLALRDLAGALEATEAEERSREQVA